MTIKKCTASLHVQNQACKTVSGVFFGTGTWINKTRSQLQALVFGIRLQILIKQKNLMCNILSLYRLTISCQSWDFPRSPTQCVGTFSHAFVATHSKKKTMRIAFPSVMAIWSTPSSNPHLWHTLYLASFCLLPLSSTPPKDSVRDFHFLILSGVG